MLLYPDVQKKAQKQLDEVAGDHLPTMDDEAQLPYIRACMKETLRWMPTTILGAVPHAVNQDDYYEGYLIPKGAGVINNVWAIHMDPKRHPEPRKFISERYETDSQSLFDAANNPDPTKRDQFSFGAGRRICPGMHVAERSLFLGISRMLWAFDISPKLDDQGQPILPNPDKLTQGFVVLPVEFPAQIKPRSEARAAVVKGEWEAAQREHLDPTTKQWMTTPAELQNITAKFA